MYTKSTRKLYAWAILCWLCSNCSSVKKATQQNDSGYEEAKTVITVDSSALLIKKVNSPLQVKYAGYLNVSPDSIVNIKLYAFIDRWLNTPYKWGGNDERGIDCSAFLQRLFGEVYGLKLPRTSIEQLLTRCVECFRSPRYLSQGDIIFFKTVQNKPVSHVGVYLQNNRFVNSSSSKGVSIGNLNDPYWKSRYVVSGRINVSLAKNSLY